MKRFAILLALLLAVASAISAQASQDGPDWFWDKPIASFQWQGVRKADRAKLDALVKDYAGKQFTETLWLDLQAKLYALDWFETIEPAAVAADAAGTRLILRFNVAEKPFVTAIRVTGNANARTAEILEAAASKPNQIYNRTTAFADDAAITRLYVEKGYPDAKVTHSERSDADKAGVILVFEVFEGEQVNVRRIQFTGNESVSERTLKGLMTLKEAALFQSGAFQEAQLAESKRAILEYYRSKGYVDAEIDQVARSYEADEGSGKKHLILTVAVREGRQWKFGGMKFEGNAVFSTEKLSSLVSLKPNAFLNHGKLILDKQRIDDLYYESGYIFNTIEMKETRDEAARTISFTVKVVERERAHIEKFTVSGNEKTKEHVIRREIPLEVGDIFSKAKIVEGLRSLYNLQYFSTVEPKMSQGSAPNLMDLVVAVEEQSMAEVQFGVTLSGIGQPGVFPVSGYVKWNDRNLGGGGQTLSTDATVSPTEQSTAISFTDNWLFGRRITGGVSLSFKHLAQTTGQDSIAPIFATEDVPDPFVAINTSSAGTGEWDGNLSSIPSVYLMPYENWDMSLGFNAGYTFKTPAGDIGLGGGYTTGVGMRSYDADRYRPYLADLRAANGIWRWYNKVYTRAYLNKLDFWYNPGQGYYASQRLTWTGILPFEYQFYAKSDTRLDLYQTLFSFPVSDTWKFSGILGLHSSFQALMKQPWMPFTVTEDWVSLDGTFNVRGWKSLYGLKGTSLWENSLELRFPVVDQVLWLDLIADAGAMRTQTGLVDMTRTSPSGDASRADWNAIGWENLAFSAGFGLRFVIPQFPFRFYFVKRFTTDGSTVTWKNTGWNFDFVLSVTQPLY